MSELHDLRPDRPASVVLTAEDVRRYIAAKHANLPCQACGAESFTMCPERDGAAGEARGLVWPLEVPESGSTLAEDVSIDLFGNLFRVFESGGSGGLASNFGTEVYTRVTVRRA